MCAYAVLTLLWKAGWPCMCCPTLVCCVLCGMSWYCSCPHRCTVLLQAPSHCLVLSIPVLHAQALECRKTEAKEACVAKGMAVAVTDSARKKLVRPGTYLACTGRAFCS